MRFPSATRRNGYVRSKAAGERVMASLERFLWTRLRLRINRAKSAVARPWNRKFLGYSVTVDRHPKLMSPGMQKSPPGGIQNSPPVALLTRRSDDARAE